MLEGAVVCTFARLAVAVVNLAVAPGLFLFLSQASATSKLFDCVWVGWGCKVWWYRAAVCPRRSAVHTLRLLRGRLPRSRLPCRLLRSRLLRLRRRALGRCARRLSGALVSAAGRGVSRRLSLRRLFALCGRRGGRRRQRLPVCRRCGRLRRRRSRLACRRRRRRTLEGVEDRDRLLRLRGPRRPRRSLRGGFGSGARLLRRRTGPLQLGRFGCGGGSGSGGGFGRNDACGSLLGGPLLLVRLDLLAGNVFVEALVEHGARACLVHEARGLGRRRTRHRVLHPRHPVHRAEHTALRQHNRHGRRLRGTLHDLDAEAAGVLRRDGVGDADEAVVRGLVQTLLRLGAGELVELHHLFHRDGFAVTQHVADIGDRHCCGGLVGRGGIEVGGGVRVWRYSLFVLRLQWLQRVGEGEVGCRSFFSPWE